ncbi:MAG: hypothetical protein EOP05_09310 [Proteobacteria bacterium]|nr:MAG: hypothetical protein EOP05_09310 [Pseudomonadota bacterium]
MKRLLLILPAAFACVLSISCSENKSNSAEKVTKIGTVDYDVSATRLNILSHREILSERYIFMEVGFDDSASSLSTKLFVDELNDTQHALTTTANLCARTRQLTEMEKAEIKTWFRKIELCRYSIPPGEAVVLTLTYPHGSFETALKTAVTFDGGYYPVSQGVSICSYAQMLELSEKLLAKFDDAIVASCKDE